MSHKRGGRYEKWEMLKFKRLKSIDSRIVYLIFEDSKKSYPRSRLSGLLQIVSTMSRFIFLYLKFCQRSHTKYHHDEVIKHT